MRFGKSSSPSRGRSRKPSACAPAPAIACCRSCATSLSRSKTARSSLIGESGCGKTTLLRILQGLVHHDAGTIRVDGAVVTGPGRDRGFVFQQASLLPWRSARHNVEFGLELQGMDGKERADRASRLLDLVGLGNAGERYPRQMSGGMQQRVALAQTRELAIDPRSCSMDEPFGALDAQTRGVLQHEMRRIQRRDTKTVLFVTHDVEEAIYLSNRVIVLAAKPGRIKKIIDIPFGNPQATAAAARPAGVSGNSQRNVGPHRRCAAAPGVNPATGAPNLGCGHGGRPLRRGLRHYVRPGRASAAHCSAQLGFEFSGNVRHSRDDFCHFLARHRIEIEPHLLRLVDQIRIAHRLQ